MIRGFPYIALSHNCRSIDQTLFGRNKYCLEERGGEYIVVRGCGESCSNCYVEIPYEEASTMFLKGEGRNPCSFIIMWESSEEALHISEGVELGVIEVEGHRVHWLVSEGDSVRVGDRVAYITTSKGEVRSVRSSFSGIVVYISQLPASKPEKLLFVIVGGENVRRARISRVR